MILVGYSGAWMAALSKFQPPGSIILLEEPDLVRKRSLKAATAESVILRELIEWEFQLDAAADCFYLTHRDLRPVAVVPVGDYSVPFAARLAELYGVPGAGFGAAVLLRDKALQRKVTAAAGIANPYSVAVSGPAELRAALARVGGPVVLKPANRQGALGTRIVHDPAEADEAWAECIVQDEGVFAPDRGMPLRMLAERFVRGTEFSVEAMVRAGEPLFASVTRKFLFDGPRPVERGHLVPADIDPELRERLLGETARVVDALGMHTGFVHCEWIVSDGVPHLVECAGRLAGGGIMDLIVLAWEYDVFGQYWDLMHGRPLAPVPTATTCHGVVLLSHEQPGEVESVDGVEAARAIPGVHLCAVGVGPGDRVQELRSSWDRVAMVMATGPTAAAALGSAGAAIDRIEVKVRPPVPV